MASGALAAWPVCGSGPVPPRASARARAKVGLVTPMTAIVIIKTIIARTVDLVLAITTIAIAVALMTISIMSIESGYGH